MDLYFLLIFLLYFLVYCLQISLYPNNKEFGLVLKLIRACSGSRLWSTVIGWAWGRPWGAWLHASASCTYRLSIRRSVGLIITSRDMHKQHIIKTLLHECFPVNQLRQSTGHFAAHSEISFVWNTTQLHIKHRVCSNRLWLCSVRQHFCLQVWIDFGVQGGFVRFVLSVLYYIAMFPGDSVHV